MAKKIPEIYEGLPTSLTGVETMMATKLTRREELNKIIRDADTERTNVEADIKHLERQARFILGTEAPSDNEIEVAKVNKDRKDKKGKFADNPTKENRPDPLPVPPAGAGEAKPSDDFGTVESPKVNFKKKTK